MSKSYWVTLTEGGSFTTPNGQRFRRNVPVMVSEGELAYFQGIPQFKVTTATPNGERRVLSSRARAETRRLQAERSKGKGEDWLTEDEIKEEAAQAAREQSEARLLELCRTKIDGRWGLERIRKLARELGVREDELDRPFEVCTVRDLTLGVTRAQTRVLIELQGGDPNPPAKKTYEHIIPDSDDPEDHSEDGSCCDPVVDEEAGTVTHNSIHELFEDDPPPDDDEDEEEEDGEDLEDEAVVDPAEPVGEGGEGGEEEEVAEVTDEEEVDDYAEEEIDEDDEEE